MFSEVLLKSNEIILYILDCAVVNLLIFISIYFFSLHIEEDPNKEIKRLYSFFSIQ